MFQIVSIYLNVRIQKNQIFSFGTYSSKIPLITKISFIAFNDCQIRQFILKSICCRDSIIAGITIYDNCLKIVFFLLCQIAKQTRKEFFFIKSLYNDRKIEFNHGFNDYNKINMKVSVIIPAYNEETRINNCLQSLISQIEKADEIIVIDNNCSDKTVQ